MLAKQPAVERIILVDEEGALPPVSALGDVMGRAGNDDAGEAGHGGRAFLSSDPTCGLWRGGREREVSCQLMHCHRFVSACYALLRSGWKIKN